MGIVVRFLLADLRSAVASSVAPVLLLIAITVFSAYFSILWPAYEQTGVRSCHTIPWSIDCILVDDSEDNTRALLDFISSRYAESRSVPVLDSECAISSDAASVAAKNDHVNYVVKAQYVHANTCGVYPIDVFSSSESVLEGDPYSGNGLIVDAAIAKRFGLSAGSPCSLGYRSVVSSKPGNAPETKFEDCVVSAVVAPDNNFSGIALFRPEDNIAAVLQEYNEYATDVYVLGLDDTSASECSAAVVKELSEDKVSCELGKQHRVTAEDSVKADAENAGYATNAFVIMTIVLIALSVLDSLRKSERRCGAYAALIQHGAHLSTLGVPVVLESVIVYALIGLVGFAVGAVLAETNGVCWVPPNVFQNALTSIALAYFCGVVIQVIVAFVAVARKRSVLDFDLPPEGRSA